MASAWRTHVHSNNAMGVTVYGSTMVSHYVAMCSFAASRFVFSSSVVVFSYRFGTVETFEFHCEQGCCRRRPHRAIEVSKSSNTKLYPKNLATLNPIKHCSFVRVSVLELHASSRYPDNRHTHEQTTVCLRSHLGMVVSDIKGYFSMTTLKTSC